MTRKKIVVLGASGFVGTTLVERLLKRSDIELIPVIHSAGSAWRLARRTGELVHLDILDRDALSRVLGGATHVVNCTRGSRAVMLDGLRHVVDECRAQGVVKFVHLSSVMVYGDPPRPETRSEDAAPDPPPGTESYGMIKFEQDKLVEGAAKAGLPSVVLCPPNISGPYSGYVAGVVDALRSDAFALLDSGESPCNLVDVRNLCHAIELSLDVTGEATDGRRIFVTDGDEVTWRDVVAELLPLAAVDAVPSITRADLQSVAGRQGAIRAARIGATLKHLLSSDVRAALRKDPLLGKMDKSVRGLVHRLGPGLETKLRIGIEGPISVSRPNPFAALAVGLCGQQLRGVRHSPKRAARVLGYDPPISFRRSMADFRAWYRAMHGMDTAFWSIARYLYARDVP
jgi:nucleoside-diphosphate-sugar epimerase